jgi:hypothetical protein
MAKTAKNAADIQEIIHQRIREGDVHEGICSLCKVTMPRRLSPPEQLRHGSNWLAYPVESSAQPWPPKWDQFVRGIIEQAMKEFMCSDPSS